MESMWKISRIKNKNSKFHSDNHTPYTRGLNSKESELLGFSEDFLYPFKGKWVNGCLKR